MAGRTVVITGGIKGIGRAIALKLAQQQDNLALNYVADDETAQQTLSLCKQIHPQVILFKADVARRQEVTTMFSAVKEAFGSIDVLINNAGLNIDKPLHDIDEEDWDRVVDTNMKGTFLCSQIASKYMLEQENEGIILNVGSSTAIRGRTNGINYCASKAGVVVMTKCLALELAPKVRVNCVIPGVIKTEEMIRRFDLDNPQSIEAWAKIIPLERIGTPEEIADVVLFLLSREARYINGQKIIVDGAQFMF